MTWLFFSVLCNLTVGSASHVSSSTTLVHPPTPLYPPPVGNCNPELVPQDLIFDSIHLPTIYGGLCEMGSLPHSEISKMRSQICHTVNFFYCHLYKVILIIFHYSSSYDVIYCHACRILPWIIAHWHVKGFKWYLLLDEKCISHRWRWLNKSDPPFTPWGKQWGRLPSFELLDDKFAQIGYMF